MSTDQELQQAMEQVSDIWQSDPEEWRGFTLRGIFEVHEEPGYNVDWDQWSDSDLDSVYAGRGLWIH